MAETPTKTFAEQMVEKLEAVLLGKASNDVLEYEIGGRQLKKYPFTEIMKLRDRFKREVVAEKKATELAAGLGNPKRKILTRF
ncbi:hypothetical protein CPG37_04545 [Malaciobacter canalis]|uniref:Uncharacterized protein n=1 Tax=Malaciobacter canalis TaxID=1912871 RepID=A0ABX4LQS5_9BACT|nr:hypothetical protein [Malaciobacter canalis]PHO10321.1 hypothetical protein CPG37_04545 [Malaciobacter canalis]QEE32426.1 hypothetical protein ACAN_0937 [Malaciobacter canalis]